MACRTASASTSSELRSSVVDGAVTTAVVAVLAGVVSVHVTMPAGIT